MAIQNSISDRNDKYSLIVQQGSAGTAAIEGTAETMRVGGDPVTGAMYVMDLAGAAGTTNVNVLSGTITEVSNLAKGTITRIEGGSLVITNGTVGLNIGSVNGGDGASDATNGLLTYARINLYNGATWDRWRGDTSNGADVDVTRLPNTPGGTLGVVSSVTEVANLAKGTITRVEGGTITRILTIGTLEVGTISSLPNLPGGTLTLVTTVSNLTNGTVRISNGTITHGTIDAGTVRLNPSPTTQSNVFGTTSSATIGTVVAAPSAGSAIIIDSLDVSAISGTPEVVIGYGIVANGNGVITRGLYPMGGGISKNPTYPIGGSITGSAVTWNTLSGSGTVAISIAYRIVVP